MPITTDVLVDTNILLRTQFDKRIHVTNATRALVEVRRQGRRLATTVQNLAEFWNVSTRPEADNGHGLQISETLVRFEYFQRSLDVLTETTGSFALWKDLVTRFEVRGKAVHDARIVSVMLAYDIRHLLTFNAKDFLRYPEIVVWHPDEVLRDA